MGSESDCLLGQLNRILEILDSEAGLKVKKSGGLIGRPYWLASEIFFLGGDTICHVAVIEFQICCCVPTFVKIDDFSLT